MATCSHTATAAGANCEQQKMLTAMLHRRLPALLGAARHRRLSGTALLSPKLQELRTRQRKELQQLERTLILLGAEENHTSVLRDTAATSVFLLCTVGEFNAGKSSLLNALLGDAHCRVGVLPTTESITLLRHTDAAAMTSAVAASSVTSAASTSPSAAADVVTVDVPTPWLRDVSVVDTPGTNTLDARHTALTQDFLPRADLLLFVTSAERPFSESERTFLRAIRSWGKKVLFVINKSDLLGSAEELRMVVDHVASNGAAELGEEVTVLPVAAKSAIALKSRAAASSSAQAGAGALPPVDLGAPLSPFAADESERLAAEQWEALEATVLRVVGSDERAAAKLRSQLSLAGAILGTYERRQQAEARLVAADLEGIAEARRRLEGWEAETEGELEAQRARISLVMHGLRQRGHDFLDAELQLSMLPRLLRRDDFVARFQRTVLADSSQQLQTAVQKVSAWMDAKGAQQVRATGELLSSKLSRAGGGEGASQGWSGDDASGAARFGIDAGSSVGNSGGGGEPGIERVAGDAGSFASQRQVLLLQLQQSASSTIDRFEPDAAAQRMITAAQSAIAQAALLTSGAAGLSGLVAVKAAALVDLTGLLPAALLAGVGLGVLPMQRYRLQMEYREKVDELAVSLDRAVEEHLKQELIDAKSRANALVTPFATLASSADARQQERLDALAASRMALEGLGGELARVSSSAAGGPAGIAGEAGSR